MNAFLLGLLIYGLLLIGIGLLLSKRVQGILDFFVAGRRLGPGLLFATLLAANIGAGSTVGAAGLGYRLGLSAWWWVGSAGIGSLILAMAVGPRIRDLSERHQFLTAGDFLEFRYSRAVRALSAVLLWVGTLAILAGQLIAIAWILEVVAGTSKTTGCLFGGLIVVIYFAAGGLKGTVWVNLFQLFVKALGFFLAVPFVISGAGGWDSIRSKILTQGVLDEAYFSLVGIGSEGVLGYLFLLVPAFIVSPGLLQKIYGARNSNAVQLGTGANGIILLGYSFLPVLLGMTAAAFFPGLGDAELALPYVMTELLPFWLGVLLLAAVFSAEISSADAILFMLSTSLSRDLYQTFFQPHAEERRMLRISRWTALIAGALGIGLAIVLPSVIVALSFFYALVSVTFFAPIILGLYSRLPQAGAATSAIAISVASASVLHLTTKGEGLGIFSPAAFGILVSLSLMLGLSALKKSARGG